MQWGDSHHEPRFVVDGSDSALTTIQTARAAVRSEPGEGLTHGGGRGCEGQIGVWCKLLRNTGLLKIAPALTSCCSRLVQKKPLILSYSSKTNPPKIPCLTGDLTASWSVFWPIFSNTGCSILVPKT